jgi:hypothetical protein
VGETRKVCHGKTSTGSAAEWASDLETRKDFPFSILYSSFIIASAEPIHWVFIGLSAEAGFR